MHITNHANTKSATKTTKQHFNQTIPKRKNHQLETQPHRKTISHQPKRQSNKQNKLNHNNHKQQTHKTNQHYKSNL